MSLGNLDRSQIRIYASSIRQEINSISLNDAIKVAGDHHARREANRFFNDIYILLHTIETQSNTLELNDLINFHYGYLVPFFTQLREIKGSIQRGSTLQAKDFQIDEHLREFLKIRSPVFSWVGNDSSSWLKTLRDLEREFFFGNNKLLLCSLLLNILFVFFIYNKCFD